MRNKIIGGVGILWGGAIVARYFLAEQTAGSEAYQLGKTGAVIIGLVMLIWGLYYVFKKQ